MFETSKKERCNKNDYIDYFCFRRVLTVEVWSSKNLWNELVSLLFENPSTVHGEAISVSENDKSEFTCHLHLDFFFCTRIKKNLYITESIIDSVQIWKFKTFNSLLTYGWNMNGINTISQEYDIYG